MARYKIIFTESGQTVAQASGGRPDEVLHKLTTQIFEKYPGGKKRVWKTQKQ